MVSRIFLIYKKHIYLIVLFIIPVILVVLWFKDANILGTGESGLPFYDLMLQFKNFSYAWANYALGYPTNITIASKPTYWFMAQLQNIGIPGFILQAAFFWVILVASGISIYFITKILFPGLGNRFLILAVFFYWFNPFSMVNVWNRFLNNFFVFYMLLPITLLFFLRGLQTKRYYYSLLIGLVSAVLSYALTSVAFNLLLWLVLFYVSVFYIFIYAILRDRFFVIKFLLLSLLFWCLTNIWWISQVFSYVYSGSFSAVEQTSFSPINNQQIFTILSQKLGNLIDIFRLQHAFFFSSSSDLQWVKLYTFPIFSFLSFAISLIIFLPLVIKKKTSSVLLLSGLTILGIFFSKGNNPPFGELFNLIFVKVGFLQTFRNAFEKFGFLLPLSGAPLFAYGSYILQERVGKKWEKYTYTILVCWLVGILGLPYFTGLVFTDNAYPSIIPTTGYQVKVPEYYETAALWLSSQKDDFRLLVFPLGNEGITYNWGKGYTGVELSNQILPVTSVSFQTNIPFYDDISTDLERILLGKNDFTKAANLLNAKYIMTRNDIDWRTRGMRNPQKIFNKLKEKENDGQFKMVNNFWGLTFWKNLNWIDRKIYLSNQVVSVFPLPKISDSQFLMDRDVLIGDKVHLNGIEVNQEVLHPIARLSLQNNLGQTVVEGQEIFPHIRFSPRNKFYQLLLLKEQLDLNLISDISGKLSFIIKMLGKRLVEVKSESELNSAPGVLIAVLEYENLLEKVIDIFLQYQLLKAEYDKQLMNQEELYNIFLKHKAILGEIINHFPTDKNIADKLRQTQELIDSKLIAENIRPLFGFKEENDFPIRKRIDYKFNVINPGEYELLWGDTTIERYYKETINTQVMLQIDDKLVPKKVVSDKFGLRSFGKFYFNPGIHEISLNANEGVNLVNTPSEVNLKVQHGVTKEIFPIKNYDSFASYTISLDYFIKTGSGVEISVVANNAKVDLGKINPDFLKGLTPDNYNFGEKHFSTGFRLNKGADSADLIFTVKPWNGCESIFFTRNKERCKDESFRYPYDRTTEVIIKNFSVTRNFVDEPVLIKSNQLSPFTQPILEFNKIDNTKYLVRVVDAKQPYILILSDLFDPGWKIFTPEREELKSKHFLVNAYANGWKIDKVGNYELIVKFVPQDLLNPTLKISLLAFILGTLFLIWRIRRK